MLTDDELDRILGLYQARATRINERYLDLIGEQIAGILGGSDAVRSKEYASMRANLAVVERLISQEIEQAISEIPAIMETAALSAYKDYARYGIAQITTNAAIRQTISAQVLQTSGTMINLSNTSIVSDLYRRSVDAAITAVQSGAIDYQSAIRSALRNTAQEGLRVQYPSGYTRRLDTAIRQNILDGARQLNQAVALAAGAEFGADGVELSAHSNSAPDHIDYQGRQFSAKAFEELQADLRRPICEWNCRHFAFPIIMGLSQPAYSQQELDDMRAHAEEQIEIDGITHTRYGWTQEQRRLETAVRGLEDEKSLLRAVGDTVGVRGVQDRISQAQDAYRQVSLGANIPMAFDRMGDGWRVPGTSQILINRPKSGIIISTRRTKSGRYTLDQSTIDKLVANELKHVNFPLPPTYNPYLKAGDGRTIIETWHRGGYKKTIAIQIGPQSRNTKEYLLDTLVHEAMEAKIMSERTPFYKDLMSRNDDREIHAYINKVIKRYFTIKGW